jgi:hypothetical protein
MGSTRQEQESSWSMKPKFVKKVLEVKRERERGKRRNNLKNSIKFVGQTDPNNVFPSRGRRETFGAGWI